MLLTCKNTVWRRISYQNPPRPVAAPVRPGLAETVAAIRQADHKSAHGTLSRKDFRYGLLRRFDQGERSAW